MYVHHSCFVQFNIAEPLLAKCAANVCTLRCGVNQKKVFAYRKTFVLTNQCLGCLGLVHSGPNFRPHYFLGRRESRNWIVDKYEFSRMNTFAYFAARRRHTLEPLTFHFKFETAGRGSDHLLDELGTPSVTAHHVAWRTQPQVKYNVSILK